MEMKCKAVDEEQACNYCGGNCNHESTGEGAIDWYEHYMSIDAADLAAVHYSRLTDDDATIGAALEQAAEERRDEIVNGLLAEGYK